MWIVNVSIAHNRSLLALTKGCRMEYCEKVKNITVSLDDEVYRRARVIAAERGTSLSALVKGYLEDLGAGVSESERLKQTERMFRGLIGDFRAGDKLSRDELHERDA